MVSQDMALFSIFGIRFVGLHNWSLLPLLRIEQFVKRHDVSFTKHYKNGQKVKALSETLYGCTNTSVLFCALCFCLKDC